MRQLIKQWFYPGINLNARERYQVLPKYFGTADSSEQRTVLDAGCGNGMLSYQAFLRGNRVIGVSIKEGEVDRCRSFFNDYQNISGEKLSFEVQDLYEIDNLEIEVDEIICTEVLEHIKDDEFVLQKFKEILKPGGALHLCCPNAEHPLHRGHELDKTESGGHVRAGYTAEMYEELLEPMGFEMKKMQGLGSPVRARWNKRIIAAEKRMGLAGGFLIFLLSIPFVKKEPSSYEVPYSLYVHAINKDN